MRGSTASPWRIVRCAYDLLTPVRLHFAISLPLQWNREGLPIGVQLVAATAREDILFQLAGQLERAQPWFDRLPKLVEET